MSFKEISICRSVYADFRLFVNTQEGGNCEFQGSFRMWQEGGGEPPNGLLGVAFHSSYWSLEALMQKINAEGAALQGSGWVVGFSRGRFFFFFFFN